MSGIGKIFKGIGKAVGKVFKAVGNIVGAVFKNPILGMALVGGAAYLAAGGFGGAAAATNAGVAEAAGGAIGAQSSVAAGLANPFTSGFAPGVAASGASTVAPAAANLGTVNASLGENLGGISTAQGQGLTASFGTVNDSLGAQLGGMTTAQGQGVGVGEIGTVNNSLGSNLGGITTAQGKGVAVGVPQTPYTQTVQAVQNNSGGLVGSIKDGINKMTSWYDQLTPTQQMLLKAGGQLGKGMLNNYQQAKMLEEQAKYQEALWRERSAQPNFQA